MILGNHYIKPVEHYQKPVYVEYREWCQDINPPPFYCELPQSENRPFVSNGTVQLYGATSSMVSTTTVSGTTAIWACWIELFK